MRLRTLILLGALTLAYAKIFRPWHMRWGATGEESTMSLPGDELVPEPAIQSTRAVTIDAPASDVWPWLIQMGYGRGGFYSYDILENLTTRAFGMRSHYKSVDRILPELQDLSVGDFIPAAPQDHLGGRFAGKIGWRVAMLEPERALALEHWGAFVLQPVEGGTTRFIARSRGPDTPLARLYYATWEIPHFIMERGMLLGVKERAEALARERATSPGGAVPATG
jgi:hypothetical protein